MTFLSPFVRPIASSLVLFVCVDVRAEEEVADQAGQQNKRARVFLILDKDKDGQLSIEEFMAAKLWQNDPAGAQTRFAKLDTDKNGYLSEEEFLRDKNAPEDSE
jgi:Ca2+-binding EF-hand superfamily protein